MINHPLRIALALLAAASASAIAAPCPTTTITPETVLPAAAVGASYDQAFSANGATAPYAFAITSGLPAGSGLALTLAGADSANLTGTPDSAGELLLTVTATDAEGCSGGRTYALSIARGDQAITFTSTPPVDASIGGTPYEVAATATSGLPVSFTIDAAAASVCSISGTSVSFQSAGTCVVDADQAGDADWNPASQAQQVFNVGAADQTITFTSTPPTDAAVGGATYEVGATATSGLPVTFAIDASAGAVCAITGSTVSFQGAGTCVINADQAGDGEWNPAPRVQQSFAVARGEQTIAFTSTAPAAATVGGVPYVVAATATSGLPVAFTIDAAAVGVCAAAGNSVTFHGVGSCIVNANQAGDANWNPAPQVQQVFAVGQGNQAITFTSTPPADAAVAGAAYAVAASATSGLPVTFSIDASATAVCSIAGNSVSFQSAGTCVINADQAGDANWNPAPRVQQSFAVGPGLQSITFTSTPPADAVVAGATYLVSASATSGLPVTFSIDASAGAVCSIAGSTVSFQGTGTCVINANQAGDANWSPAPQAQQAFAVGPGSQTIAFTSTPPTNAAAGAATYDVAASATSGLPVAFTIDASAAGVCAVAGSTVSFLAGGTCVINANQAGDANWNPAPQVQQSFSVSACLSLAIGQVVTAQMPGGADFCVLNGDAANAEFTYLPIHAGTSGEPTLSALATNVVPVTGPPTPVVPAESGIRLAPLADAVAGDVHAIDESLPFARGEAVDPSHLVREVHGVVPPFVGQLLDLDASVGGCSITPDVRKARVEAITAAVPGQQRLYAAQEVVESSPGAGDWHPPVPGGFATVDFQNIIDAFVQAPPGQTDGSGTLSGLLRTGAMDALTTYFGGVTDVDVNGGVIVFFTPKLNELSPPASGSAAHALFQVRDLLSASSCPGSNEGEILYMLVPDPTGAVNSNVRTLSFVYGTAEPMLVHHAAHLAYAARRLYSVGGPQELAWLEEAVAWEMQELIFFNASVGLAPRTNIGLTDLTTGPNASVRVAAFNTFENPIYGNMRTYFHQFPGAFGGRRFGPLRQLPWTVPGVTLHDQTAAPYAITSAFLRYALDRRNTGDAALIGALVNSSQTGIANLEAVFGMDAEEWLRDFLVAMYAEDAGIPGVAAQYTAPSWNYRSVYSGLGGYPLVTNPLGDGVALTFGLTHGGGTRYLRFGIAPGQVANVTLTEGGAPPSSPIATALVRTR